MAAYLSSVLERLRSDGFRITEHIVFRNQTFSYVARRTRFDVEYFGFNEVFFVFAEFHTLGTSTLREFSAKCFEYAKKSKRIPLPCGLSESVVCFPVAIVSSIDEATAEDIRNNTPSLRWAAYEMPVICELTSQTLHYLEKTPKLGALHYESFRETIRAVLKP